MTPTPDLWTTATDSPGVTWTAAPDTPARFGVVVLHEMPLIGAAVPGSSPPKDVAAWVEAIVAHGGAVAAPWTGSSWWTDGGVFASADSSSDIQAALDGALDWFAAAHGLEPPKIAITGSGAGGHGALRLAYQTPQRFGVVTALRPAIDWHKRLEPSRGGNYDVSALRTLYGDPERARQDSATLHIHPLNWPRWQRFACPLGDPNHEGADRLAMKLTSLGVPHDAELAQPDSPAYDATQIATLTKWIAEKLAAQ